MHQGSGLGSGQGLERFEKVHQAEQFLDFILVWLSVRKKKSNVPNFEVKGRRVFTPSQQESFDGVEGPMNSEREAGSAAWKRSGPADYEMRLLLSEFLKQLHGLLGTSSFYALEIKVLLEWSPEQQFRITAPALTHVFAIFDEGLLVLCRLGHQLSLEQE